MTKPNPNPYQEGFDNSTHNHILALRETESAHRAKLQKELAHCSNCSHYKDVNGFGHCKLKGDKVVNANSICHHHSIHVINTIKPIEDNPK